MRLKHSWKDGLNMYNEIRPHDVLKGRLPTPQNYCTFKEMWTSLIRKGK